MHIYIHTYIYVNINVHIYANTCIYVFVINASDFYDTFFQGNKILISFARHRQTCSCMYFNVLALFLHIFYFLRRFFNDLSAIVLFCAIVVGCCVVVLVAAWIVYAFCGCFMVGYSVANVVVVIILSVVAEWF